MIAARLTELRMDEVGTGCHEPRGNPKLMKKSGCYLGPTQIRSISHDRRLDVGAGGGDVLLHFFSHFRKRVALDFPSAGIERDRIAFGQSHYNPCDGPSRFLQKTKKSRTVGPRRTADGHDCLRDKFSPERRRPHCHSPQGRTFRTRGQRAPRSSSTARAFNPRARQCPRDCTALGSGPRLRPWRQIAAEGHKCDGGWMRRIFHRGHAVRFCRTITDFRSFLSNSPDAGARRGRSAKRQSLLSRSAASPLFLNNLLDGDRNPMSARPTSATFIT